MEEITFSMHCEEKFPRAGQELKSQMSFIFCEI